MSNMGRFLLLLILLAVLAVNAVASLTCTPAAGLPFVRSEGLTEPMGDIVLLCTGGEPNGTLTGTLTVFLSVPVTNRVSATGVADAVLTADNGSGSGSSGAIPTIVNNGSGVAFNGINVALSPSGGISLRVTNLRGAVAQQGIDNTTPIRASLAYNGGPFLLTLASVTVGLPSRTLLAGATTATINCSGSPAPDTISMSGLFAAGTRSFTQRLTPGFANAFEKRRPGTDSGVRIMLSYFGLPAAARLFVPDVVAGSDATQRTSGGDFTSSASGGSYTPGGNGTLLLARVRGADVKGAGGSPVYLPGAPGSGTVAFNGATELTLVGGAAQAVYEVVDANPLARAIALVPTFIAIDDASSQSSGGTLTTMLAPVSTIDRATQTDPVLRFVAALPAPDCQILGDCDSFPRLLVNAPPLEYTAVSGSAPKGTWFTISNDGGGSLVWSISSSYINGSGWMDVSWDPWGNVWVKVFPQSLAPGLYQAILTIEAGFAGSRSLPVKLTVTAPAPVVKIDSVTNAATYAPGPVAPGSLAMLKGSKLSGTAVTVAFDSLPARLFYNSDTQINLLVPVELGSRASAQAVVTVDGAASAPFTVSLTPIGPGIFPGGVLNQDTSVNSAANPAMVGTVAIVFATGLPEGAGLITAKIHDREIAVPEYAGPAPTLVGVQQVNLRIPADLPPMTTDLLVCGLNASTSQRVCSPPARITLRQ